MLTKTTLASLDAAKHTEHMEEQNTDKMQNKTAYLLNRQCGIFTTSRRFRCITAEWAVSRTSGGIVKGASAMLSHERMAQKKKTKEYDFSGHET